MIEQDEDGLANASSPDATKCVKCGTKYTNEVEYTQHLLLHVERTYLTVNLNRNSVQKEFLVTPNSDHHEEDMSAEEASDMNEQEEEVEVKPKPIFHMDQNENPKDSPAEENDKGKEDGGSESQNNDEDGSASQSSSVNETSKITVKADVHASDVSSTPAKAETENGEPEENSKPLSGTEDDESQHSEQSQQSQGKVSEGSKSPAKPTTPSLPNIGITLRKSEDLMAQTNYNLIQAPSVNFSNGEFQGPPKGMFQCPVCPRSFGSAGEMEAHAVAEAHFVCSASPACASLTFDSPASLAHHVSRVHQPPAIQTTNVQRLAAQVERLPQTFGGYQGYPGPRISQYGGPPLAPPASFNGPKLGSQVVLTPVPVAPSVTSLPPPAPQSLPNLPGIQVTKRPAPVEPTPIPSKIGRSDDGVPHIRLPDSITLVKSQPPRSEVADMLATRGITMVASGIRGSSNGPSTTILPVSPKRLPNVPSAISITPSRVAQPSNSVQQFAVPPAPARGRPLTNLGTVDLTRDDAQRMRPGRPPVMGNSQPRRFSCTICDKVYPTSESLQAHMAVHGGTKGRFMCEICRVVYTNEAKLAHHKRTVHGGKTTSADTSGPEFVIPICDVNQPGVKEKLLQCGIRHIVQLSSLRNAKDSATFGLPIIPIDLARNEAFSRLDDLGASNILSLGTLKSVQR